MLSAKCQQPRSRQQARFAVATTSLCLALCFVALLSSQQITLEGAFVAANEQVGYRACVHLMLRLVDCLIDACDLYLAQLSDPPPDTPLPKPIDFGQTSADQKQPIAVDASNLLNDKGDIRIEAIDKNLLLPIDEFDGEQVEFPTTKPMNWVAADLNPFKAGPMNEANSTSTSTTTTTVRPPESSILSDVKPSPLLPPESNANLNSDVNIYQLALDEDNLSTSSCWPKAIKWIKEQLIASRMNLMNGANASLRDTLDKFSELNGYLSDVCPTLSIGDSRPRMDHLGYVVEAIEVLNQINKDAKEKKDNKEALVGPAGEREESGPNKEKSATDAIKENYSYLTQIITSYNLVFNAIDEDIMGKNGSMSEHKEGAQNTFDQKMNGNSAHEPMSMDNNNEKKIVL